MSLARERPADLRIEGLRKSFGRVAVLNGIDLRIAPGRITAIVGPNAAGKTTLIKTIVGLVRPERSGRVTLDGEPVGATTAARGRIGYMPQAAQFPAHLTGREILSLLRSVRGDPADVDLELVEAFGLAGSLDRKLGTLSGGTLQKLNAVVAFLFRPALLILDEPTAGLDPVASGFLKDRVLRAPAEGVTVVLTSHILSEIEELAQDIVFLIEGRVVFEGTVQSLKAMTNESRLERAVAALLRGAR
jgi:Cu-processing system ATP-binding protein